MVLRQRRREDEPTVKERKEMNFLISQQQTATARTDPSLILKAELELKTQLTATRKSSLSQTTDLLIYRS